MPLTNGHLPELSDDYGEPVRDPIWKNIYLSPEMKELISTPPMQKLNGIKQLGPTYLVYPGATHTRFSHSLGVFFLARRIVRKLLSFSDSLHLEPESVRSFLCAALLHDLGHFPYAHSLKELPLTSHEALTARMILEEPLKSVLKDRVKADPFTTAAVVDESMDAGDRGDIRFYRRILSGVLDPDKLDYLTRDAYFCGVPYGVQDTDFVLDRIMPSGETIYLSPQGLPALENILFSKYLMYRTVYWHKTVRIATAMIKKSVLSALREGIILPENLYGLEDEEFHAAYTETVSPVFAHIRRVKARELYKTAYEVPFNPENSTHRELMSLVTRLRREEDIADGISAEGVPLDSGDCIIDVPEPISFEIDIPLPEGEVTPFTGPTVTNFRESLRKIRLILPAEIATRVGKWEQLTAW